MTKGANLWQNFVDSLDKNFKRFGSKYHVQKECKQKNTKMWTIRFTDILDQAYKTSRWTVNPLLYIKMAKLLPRGCQSYLLGPDKEVWQLMNAQS